MSALMLGRGAAAIGVRGRVYSKATIDMDLFIRHEEKKVRRAGGRTRGPAAFTNERRETARPACRPAVMMPPCRTQRGKAPAPA